MYIDFTYYKANGGTIADEAAFTLSEKRARYKLDYYTQNRITEPIEECVKDCMVELVNVVFEQSQGEKVSSFSNDGISVSLVDTNEEQNLYDLILQMLPRELTYLGV